MDNNNSSEFTGKRLGGHLDNCVLLNVVRPKTGGVAKIAMGIVKSDSVWNEGILLRTSMIVHVDYDEKCLETLNTHYTFDLCDDQDTIDLIKLQCPFQLADS